MPVGTTTGTQSHTIGWTTLRHYSTVGISDAAPSPVFKHSPPAERVESERPVHAPHSFSVFGCPPQHPAVVIVTPCSGDDRTKHCFAAAPFNMNVKDGATYNVSTLGAGDTGRQHQRGILKGDSFDVKDFKMDPDTFFTVLIITCVQLSESNGLEPVTADVKSSALLPCTGTAHRGQAEVKWKSSGDPVFVYHQGNLTAGPGFKNRVNLSKEEIEGGNFSLIISPVEYSDKGLYSCFYNNEWLHDVRLDVVVPTVVSVPIGDSVRLHCYADINRQIEDSQLDVRWEKEGKLVLHLHSGLVTQGSGFKNRVDVSKEDIRKGDLSLILNETRLSDQGHYQCFYNEEKKTGDPRRISLKVTAREHNHTAPECTPVQESSKSLVLVLAVALGLAGALVIAVPLVAVWCYHKWRKGNLCCRRQRGSQTDIEKGNEEEQASMNMSSRNSDAGYSEPDTSDMDSDSVHYKMSVLLSAAENDSRS